MSSVAETINSSSNFSLNECEENNYTLKTNDLNEYNIEKKKLVKEYFYMFPFLLLFKDKKMERSFLFSTFGKYNTRNILVSLLGVIIMGLYAFVFTDFIFGKVEKNINSPIFWIFFSCFCIGILMHVISVISSFFFKYRMLIETYEIIICIIYFVLLNLYIIEECYYDFIQGLLILINMFSVMFKFRFNILFVIICITQITHYIIRLCYFIFDDYLRITKVNEGSIVSVVYYPILLFGCSLIIIIFLWSIEFEQRIGFLNNMLNKKHNNEKKIHNDIINLLVKNCIPKLFYKDLNDKLNSNIHLLINKKIEGVCICADIVGFTKYSSNITSSELIIVLNDIYGKFDLLSEILKVEKIKTIGDAFLAISYHKSDDYPDEYIKNAVIFAIGMQKIFCVLRDRKLNLRIGMALGEIEFIIGIKKYVMFDVYGNVVDKTFELESKCPSNDICVCENFNKKCNFVDYVLLNHHNKELLYLIKYSEENDQVLNDKFMRDDLNNYILHINKQNNAYEKNYLVNKINLIKNQKHTPKVAIKLSNAHKCKIWISDFFNYHFSEFLLFIKVFFQDILNPIQSIKYRNYLTKTNYIPNLFLYIYTIFLIITVYVLILSSGINNMYYFGNYNIIATYFGLFFSSLILTLDIIFIRFIGFQWKYLIDNVFLICNTMLIGVITLIYPIKDVIISSNILPLCFIGAISNSNAHFINICICCILLIGCHVFNTILFKEVYNFIDVLNYNFDCISMFLNVLLHSCLQKFVYKKNYLSIHNFVKDTNSLKKRIQLNETLISSFIPNNLIDDFLNNKTINHNLSETNVFFVKIAIMKGKNVDYNYFIKKFQILNNILDKNNCQRVKINNYKLLFHCLDPMDGFRSLIRFIHAIYSENICYIKCGAYKGPVSQGVMGNNRIKYDLIGNTVNMASRLVDSCPYNYAIHFIKDNIDITTNFTYNLLQVDDLKLKGVSKKQSTLVLVIK